MGIHGEVLGSWVALLVVLDDGLLLSLLGVRLFVVRLVGRVNVYPSLALAPISSARAARTPEHLLGGVFSNQEEILVEGEQDGAH